MYYFPFFIISFSVSTISDTHVAEQEQKQLE